MSGDSSEKFRASADGYKPHKYVQISTDDWNIFVCLAEDPNNAKLRVEAERILNRLV